MFLAPRWHVRSVEQTILRAGGKRLKHTTRWIYRTRTSRTKSSSSRRLDHLEDPRSKEFGGSLQFSLLLRLSRSISMLLTDCSARGQPCAAVNGPICCASSVFEASSGLVCPDYGAEVVQHADPCPVRASERAVLRIRDRVTDRVWPCIPDRAVSKPIAD